MRAYAQGGHRTGQAGRSGCHERRQPEKAATEATEGLDVMNSNGFRYITDVAGFKRVIGANGATEGVGVVFSNGLHTIVDMTGLNDVLVPKGCE